MVEQILEIVKVLLLGIPLFIFPGYAVLSIFKVQQEFDFINMLCASAGFSISIITLTLYTGTYLGVQFNTLLVILFLSVTGGITLWDWTKRFRGFQEGKFDLIVTLLGFISLLIVISRVWMVKDMAFPPWTDSYHHTIITQLIVDNGIVPDSYEPYVPITDFTYHIGFHTLAAFFHWLANLPVPQSVVLVGQLVNALVVPTTFLLTRRLFQSAVAGLVAALVVGFLSHMPASYVNWGRYTQLSGQILLPVVMVFTLQSLNPNIRGIKYLLLTGVGAAGLFLTHYRVFLFYALFALILLIFRLVAERRNPQSVKRLILSSVIMGSVTVIILVPWLWNFFDGFGAAVAQDVADGYKPQQHGSYFSFRPRDLLDFGMWWEYWVIVILGLLWGIFKNEKNVWLLAIWLLCLFAAANLYIIGIMPLFSNLVVIIFLYLPIAVFVGYFASQLFNMVLPYFEKKPRLKTPLIWVATIVFITISLVGARNTFKVFDPNAAFVLPADVEAMEWIRQNVKTDSLFYIDTHFWTPRVAHGLDGGYWIPFLTGRDTILPPQIYLSDGSAEYAGFINRRAHDLLIDNHTNEELWQAMNKYGITHIYIGKRLTNLRPEMFLSYPNNFKLAYSRDGVWIFEVIK